MPYRRGERYFFYVNEGLQEHSVFCMADSIGGERTILVDPNEFSADRQVVELLGDFDATYYLLNIIDGIFYVMTDLDAPRYRVIAIDPSNPSRENWAEIIP